VSYSSKQSGTQLRRPERSQPRGAQVYMSPQS